MTKRNEIQAKQSVKAYTRRNARRLYYGTLGNNAGTVDHATRTDYVYLRLHGDSNQVVEAYAAASFPHVAELVVDVERVEKKGAPYYQVLGVSAGIVYSDADAWAGVPGAHAEQHQRRDRNTGGFDPLDIYNRALVNLRARAQTVPALTLYVERGFYVITAFKEFVGGNSPAFSAPTGSFSVQRWDLLYLGNDDALHVLQGTPAPINPAYPTCPANCIPIAYVILSNSSTVITEDMITDARTILSSNQATATAHNLLSAVHTDTLTAAVVDGDVIIGNVTPAWSRLAISIPAANVRNVLGIDNGELRPSWKTALDGTNPTTIAVGDVAAPGTSLVFSHRDHQHASPATWTATAHAIDGATHTVAGRTAGQVLIATAAATFGWSGFLLSGTAGGTTNFAVTNAKTLTLTATDDFNLTIPKTGTAVVGTGTATRVAAWSDANTIAAGTIVQPAANVLTVTNSAAATLALAITAGKTLTLTAVDNYNVTFPATGTAALLATANIFTAVQTVNLNAAALPAPPATAVLHLGNADVTATLLTVDTFGAGVASTLQFRRSRGTAASPSAVNSGNALGYFQADGYGATAYTSTGRALIGFWAAENWTDAAQGTYINFYTTPIGSTTLTERMRLTAPGYLGINTIVPVGLLTIGTVPAATDGTTHLSGHDGTGGFRFVTATGIDGTAKVLIANATGDAVYGVYIIAFMRQSGGNRDVATLRVNNGSDLTLITDGVNTWNLRVNADGSVDVRRTAGTETLSLSMWIVWL